MRLERSRSRRLAFQDASSAVMRLSTGRRTGGFAAGTPLEIGRFAPFQGLRGREGREEVHDAGDHPGPAWSGGWRPSPAPLSPWKYS